MFTPEETAILLTLDGLVRHPTAWQAINAMTAELRSELARQPDSAFVRRQIPLELFGGNLPAEVRSSNIYVLRPNGSSPAERHPNSHQRSLSLAGRGDFPTQHAGVWHAHPLRSEPSDAVENRWASIPPNTWHQAVVGEEVWVLVSFHTEADSQILAESLPH